MKTSIVAFVAGSLFGFGLCLSRMVDPEVVIGFLDVTGQWDGRLLLVMSGALLVSFAAYPVLLVKARPFCAQEFHLPSSKNVDKNLIVGAILFGIGWGLAGICPGPAVTVLVYGVSESYLFFGAMIVGMLLYNAYERINKNI